MKKLILLVLGLVCANGCATFQSYTASYGIEMAKVERPQKTRLRYGQIVEVALADSNRYSYQDSLVTAYMVPGWDRISFRIENKTDHTLKLIWDEAAFIDTDGSAQKVLHTGVRYVDSNASYPPSIIPGHGFVEDFAIPADRVYFRRGTYSSDWEHKGLILPNYWVIKAPSSAPQPVPPAFAEAVAGNVGKSIGLLLPLEIEGVVNEYTFWFSVKSYHLVAPSE